MNKAQEILARAEKYNNSKDLLFDIYGITNEEKYDAFVIAPSWTPERIFRTREIEIECLTKRSYFSSYRVRNDKFSIGWLQCAAGAGNLIDTVLCIANSNVPKVIFIGTVGALKQEIKLGEIATPQESYAFSGGSLYLSDKIDAGNWGKVVKPHNTGFIEKVLESASREKVDIKKRRIFCTDSILCEYSHLDFIKNMGAELIEMETAAFYECMKMMNKDGIALLCVSDNSVAGISLTSRTQEETQTFHQAREEYIPKLIEIVCKM